MPKEPTLDVQRKVLAEKEARYRGEAWEHGINADLALTEATPDDPRYKLAAEESKRESERLYRLADECAKRLAALPKPKPAADPAKS